MADDRRADEEAAVASPALQGFPFALSTSPLRRGQTALLTALGTSGIVAAVLIATGGLIGTTETGTGAARAASASPTFALHAAGLARDGTPEPTPIPTATPTATPSPTPGLPPHPTTPAGLRTWSDGDSTSYFMSVAFLRLMEAGGAISTQPAAEYKISSGLLSPGFFNWPAYFESEMALRQPEVVVFMIGANDAHPGMDLDVYRERVRAAMDQLRAPGRVVLWVGQPIMDPALRPDLFAAIPAMNTIFAEEAAARAWVTYVDAWALTTDSGGNYQQYLPNADGVYELIRADDGVHFSPAGGRRLAEGVMAALFPPQQVNATVRAAEQGSAPRGPGP